MADFTSIACFGEEGTALDIPSNPRDDTEGRQYLMGCRCSSGLNMISPPRGGRGRA